MRYTLGTAAKATGASKSSILRAIRSGRLSYVEKDASGYHIEASELYRVFQPVTPAPVPLEQTATDLVQPEPAVTLRIRELEIRLESALERMKEIQDDRDHWRRQATALLENKRSQPEQGLWGRLLKRK
jgi:hypothetical protein